MLSTLCLVHYYITSTKNTQYLFNCLMDGHLADEGKVKGGGILEAFMSLPKYIFHILYISWNIWLWGFAYVCMCIQSENNEVLLMYGYKHDHNRTNNKIFGGVVNCTYSGKILGPWNLSWDILKHSGVLNAILNQYTSWYVLYTTVFL